MLELYNEEMDWIGLDEEVELMALEEEEAVAVALPLELDEELGLLALEEDKDMEEEDVAAGN